MKICWRPSGQAALRGLAGHTWGLLAVGASSWGRGALLAEGLLPEGRLLGARGFGAGAWGAGGYFIGALSWETSMIMRAAR